MNEKATEPVIAVIDDDESVLKLAGIRQIVETVNGCLQHVFRLDRERPHSLDGFQVRLAAKIALHDFCPWLNQQLGRAPLAFADLVAG